MRSTLPVLAATACLALGAGVAGAFESDGIRVDDTATSEPTIGGTATLVSDGVRSVLVPITPCRLVDTRPDTAVGDRRTPIGASETITIESAGPTGDCSLPASGVAALSLNVTAVDPSAPTFLTVWGSGSRPGSSSLNPFPGQPPTPNAVTTQVDPGGAFSIFNAFGSVDVIVDVVAYYTDHDHDDRYDTSSEVDAKISSALAQRPPTPDGPTHGRQMRATDRVASYSASGLPKLAIDPFGQTVIAFVESNAGRTPRIVRCQDRRCDQLSGDTTFAPDGRVATVLDIAIDPAGEPAALVVTGSGQVEFRTCLAFCVAGTDAILSIGSTGDLTFGPDGTPVAVVEDTTADRVAAVFCTTFDCSNQQVHPLAPLGGGGGAAQISIRGDGTPVAAVTTTSAAGVEIVTCTTPFCRADGQVSHVIGSGVPVHDSLSMTLGFDGAPIVTWVDAASGAAWLVRCTAVDCSTAAAPVTLAPSGAVDTEVVVDGAGLPAALVMLASIPADSLLVRCTDVRCVAPTVDVELGDTVGGVAADLAVDHTGVPVLVGASDTGAVTVEQVAGSSHVPGGAD